MTDLSDERIVGAWHSNAAPWTDAVRAGTIASRRLVTDRAVVDTVLRCAPRTVLDIGCGEGWLARALAAQGIDVLGIDVVPALVEQARRAGGGEFRVVSYENLAAGKLQISVDAAVCNFSLLGEASVVDVLRSVPALLNPGGTLVIQTLHPLQACSDLPYRDGWREGTWAGIDGDFAEPAPWYFRTLESWVQLVLDSGLRIRALLEPLHPETGKPASLLLIAQCGE